MLEQAGLLQRGADVTIRGNLTLLGEWSQVLPLLDQRHVPLLERLRLTLPELAWSPQEILLADEAARIDCVPAALEAALIELSVASGCLYRPWEKGYQIVRLATPATPIPPVGLDAVAVQADKLQQMRAFVAERGCRWQALRRYFGEDIGAPCGNCDRCAAEQIYPGAARQVEIYQMSVIFLILPPPCWSWPIGMRNASKLAMRRLARARLCEILRGDEYVLMRYTTAGSAADARRRALRACPYWGVCRTLRRSAEELNALFDRLLGEQYLELVEADLGNDASYQYVRPTERGRAQLFSGERLGWS